MKAFERFSLYFNNPYVFAFENKLLLKYLVYCAQCAIFVCISTARYINKDHSYTKKFVHTNNILLQSGPYSNSLSINYSKVHRIYYYNSTENAQCTWNMANVLRDHSYYENWQSFPSIIIKHYCLHLYHDMKA